MQRQPAPHRGLQATQGMPRSLGRGQPAPTSVSPQAAAGPGLPAGWPRQCRQQRWWLRWPPSGSEAAALEGAAAAAAERVQLPQPAPLQRQKRRPCHPQGECLRAGEGAEQRRRDPLAPLRHKLPPPWEKKRRCPAPRCQPPGHCLRRLLLHRDPRAWRHLPVCAVLLMQNPQRLTPAAGGPALAQCPLCCHPRCSGLAARSRRHPWPKAPRTAAPRRLQAPQHRWGSWWLRRLLLLP